MKQGEYRYHPCGKDFRIYRCTYADGKGAISEPVPGEPLYANREEARRRVYELNGWKYKEANH